MSKPAPAIDGSIRRVRSPFFVWMAGYCLVLTIAGFTRTYWAPLATASLVEVTPIIHLHGAVFFSWMLLSFLQSWLVKNGRVAAHRSIGLLGISLATAMLIFGFNVSLAANVARIEAGQISRAYAFGFSNTFALVAFATLFAFGIYKRRHPETHKRLMLFASSMLLNPPVGRLYRPLFAPSPPPPWVVFMTIDVILVACILFDLKTTRRVHPVTIASGVVLLAFQILRFPIPRMSWWHATYDKLLGLIM